MAMYSEEYARVAALHEHPDFVSWEFASETMLPCSIASVVCVSILHVISSIVVTNLVLPKSEFFAQRKASYQLTNMCVNAVIGLTGLFYYIYKIPSDPTLEQKVEGLEELYPVTCMQIGFQLWALPVGMFWIKESLPMLGHHVAVILVAFMSGFCNMGFRYFTPLMFGMMELSSVPLAVMNAFKDNPELSQRYPAVYFPSRALFAFSFLYIRWYMVFPPVIEFLRLLSFSTYSYKLGALKVYHVIIWAFAHFLALLQIFWGSLILKSMLHTVLSTKKKES